MSTAVGELDESTAGFATARACEDEGVGGIAVAVGLKTIGGRISCAEPLSSPLTTTITIAAINTPINVTPTIGGLRQSLFQFVDSCACGVGEVCP